MEEGAALLPRALAGRLLESMLHGLGGRGLVGWWVPVPVRVMVRMLVRVRMRVLGRQVLVLVQVRVRVRVRVRVVRMGP